MATFLVIPTLNTKDVTPSFGVLFIALLVFVQPSRFSIDNPFFTIYSFHMETFALLIMGILVIIGIIIISIARYNNRFKKQNPFFDVFSDSFFWVGVSIFLIGASIGHLFDADGILPLKIVSTVSFLVGAYFVIKFHLSKKYHVNGKNLASIRYIAIAGCLSGVFFLLLSII